MRFNDDMGAMRPHMFQDDFMDPFFSGHHRAPPMMFGGPHEFRNRGQGEFLDKGDSYEVCISADGFNPEDLSVEVNADNLKLTVKAKKEETLDGQIVSTKQFSKTYDLPSDCKIEEMGSLFTESGQLKISAPKTKEAIEAQKKRQIQQQEQQQRHLQHQGTAGAGVGASALANRKISQTHNLFPSARLEEVNDTESCFEVKINVDGFEPNDLHVEVKADGILSIIGNHEEKRNGNVVSNKLHRSFALPENCKLAQIESNFSKDGILTVTAPKNVQKPIEETRKVPINVSR